MTPTLPDPPATAAAALDAANSLAYGFKKHTDVAYWDNLGYLTDPWYFWKRLLGWQAGGDDAPRFGLYANPVTDWYIEGDQPAPTPIPLPVPSDQVMLALSVISAQLAQVDAKLDRHIVGTVRGRVFNQDVQANVDLAPSKL